MPCCRTLLIQFVRCADFFALLNAGSNIEARMAMIAMTTNNSISVKARRIWGPKEVLVVFTRVMVLCLARAFRFMTESPGTHPLLDLYAKEFLRPRKSVCIWAGRCQQVVVLPVYRRGFLQCAVRPR